MSVVSGLDLSGDRYTIKQKLIRSRYTVYDQQGNAQLKAKKKRFKLKEEFPFKTPDGEPVFTIKAGGVFDVAGDYTITDAQTGEEVAVLDKNFTFFQHSWKVRAPDGRVLANIEGQGALLEAARHHVPLMGFLPHEYTIESPDGKSMGTIKGQFSLRDQYEVEITDSGSAPKEALVIAGIAIDALEGN
ncbi:LURP-one-related/scramblase family protein [Haloarchaeobius sp. DFWS5]|uniref:LURP-one-related/scramblase family protein n=1 Tax=Haloarchaeobius sp. DFWS5 TaxID=3446114 RepID=UPI003EBF69E9